MKFYLAPLEGVTHHLYRRIHHNTFGPMDKYFTPFISAHPKLGFSQLELDELNPDNNLGLNVVPQILSNKAAEFTITASAIADMGYKEINLNLGCPSNTVVSKNRGSGFLIYKEELDVFLNEIYAHAKVPISVKTRLGKFNPDEFYDLVRIFNQYPISELIVHPRIQRDMYKNTPRMDVFEAALSEIKSPVCYNGDIFSTEDYQALVGRFSGLETVMLGRGIIGNPGLVDFIKKGTMPPLSQYKAFHDAVYDTYKHYMRSEKAALSKMKEQWFYMHPIFTNAAFYYDAIKTCNSHTDYVRVVNALFENEERLENPSGYRIVAERLQSKR